jgi:hypothetical protein
MYSVGPLDYSVLSTLDVLDSSTSEARLYRNITRLFDMVHDPSL